MNDIVKSLLTRLNNKGTLIALAGLIVSLLVQFGVDIDSEKVISIVQTICSILIILGVLNNPIEGVSGYIPGVSDKLVKRK